MRKPTFCLCENKDADQLRGNREAEQRLCFRYLDSTIPLLPKSKISSFYPSPVAVQPGLCQTWSECVPSIHIKKKYMKNTTENCHYFAFLSRVVKKTTFCICENKDADQLRGNREADQRLCFRYLDNTIPYFLNP